MTNHNPFGSYVPREDRSHKRAILHLAHGRLKPLLREFDGLRQ